MTMANPSSTKPPAVRTVQSGRLLKLEKTGLNVSPTKMLALATAQETPVVMPLICWKIIGGVVDVGVASR